MRKKEKYKAIVLDRQEQWIFCSFVFVFGRLLFVWNTGTGNSESILVQEEAAHSHQKVEELPLGWLWGLDRGSRHW